MKQKQINNYKKNMKSISLFAILMVISFILMLIGYLNTDKIDKWMTFYTLATYVFLFFSIIFIMIVLAILGFKIRSTARREKSKTSEINVMFLKISEIIMSTFFLMINFCWLVFGCLYYLKINMIQAIFMIIISIFSIFFTFYFFYYYSKIKITKIKMEDILKYKRDQWWYLKKFDFDSDQKD